MDLNEHTKPENLLKYAFYYNEARLVLAALTLLLGKMSPVLYYLPIPFVTRGFVTLAWIIAGVAAAYLLYRWHKGGQTLWGGNDMQDKVAFAIAVISGLHLGWAGLTGDNIGFIVLSPLLGIVMPLAGLAYLWAAYHLGKRYKDDPNMFGEAKPKEAPEGASVESTPPATPEEPS